MHRFLIVGLTLVLASYGIVCLLWVDSTTDPKLVYVLACVIGLSAVLLHQWTNQVVPDVVLVDDPDTHFGPPLRIVRIEFVIEEAREVFLAGEFPGQEWALLPMRRTWGDTFEILLQLPEGEYRYNFVVGDIWLHDTEGRDRLTRGHHQTHNLLCVTKEREI